jgi:hypothetical protein
MTPAADDALSHDLVGAIPQRRFEADQGSQIY